jgi:Rhs element Vgr protein
MPGQYHVLSVTVTRELNRIPAATIHIKDGDAASQTFPVSDTELFIPGKEIEIQLGYRSKNETVFKGIVVRHGIRARQSGALLVLECKDVAVKLTQGAKSAYFLDKKDSEIIEDVFDSYGITADVDPTDVDPEAVVQFDSTDWDFILCRAEANGRVVSVIDGAVTVKAPDAAQEPALTVGFGSTLMELDVEMDARLQDEAILARAWSAADQGLAESDAAEPTEAGNGNIDSESLAAVLGGGTSIVAHGGSLGEPELQAWADGRLLKERFARTRGRAVFQGFPTIFPGDTIQVDGIGDRFAGKFYVSGVRHSVVQGNWQTDVQLGLDPELFARAFNVSGLAAAGLVPAVHGLQIGTVTALAGDPDGEHRIRIRMPIVSDSDDGVWARLATLDAGSERGTYFRPEIDDEVVVGFINGDPRHAVVLGMLHSSAKPTPEPLSDDNGTKGYVSREKLILTFDDDKKIIRLETPAGNALSLSEEDSGITMADQNGNKITLSTAGITLESAKDLTIKAASTVKVDAVNIELGASAGLTASGSGTAELKGATTTVQGSASLTLSGGLVKIN